MIRKGMILGTAMVLSALAGAGYAQEGDVTYTAELKPLNATAAGSEAEGTATLAFSGDALTITIDAKGTPPGIMHLQHFHGFAEGDKVATCPGADADSNGDGVVDLIETEPFSGVTMAPFQGDPADMEIMTDTYPTADADGAYHYEKTVSLSALEAAFEKAFPDQKPDFDRRVIYIHGVPADTDLPASAQSLGDVPAQVTLPIACGELRESAG